MNTKDPTWGWPTWAAFALILSVFVWFIVPSSVFYQPVNMAVVKNPQGRWIAIAERRLPWGPKYGRTQALIQVLGREDGQECQWTTEGLFVPRDNNVTRYDITEWAAPCLDSGPPISILFSRTVYLGGIIPLRPVHYSFTLNNPEAVPVLPIME